MILSLHVGLRQNRMILDRKCDLLAHSRQAYETLGDNVSLNDEVRTVAGELHHRAQERCAVALG